MQECHGATALKKRRTNKAFVHVVNLRFIKLSLHRAQRLWPEGLSTDGCSRVAALWFGFQGRAVVFSLGGGWHQELSGAVC